VTVTPIPGLEIAFISGDPKKKGDGAPCTARVRKLYLPPGVRYVGRRRCYDLTYASCQQHDKRFDAVRRQLKEVWA